MKKTYAAAAFAISCLWSAQALAQSDQSSGEDETISRITIELPLLTRHVPNDSQFNDHNWGGFIDFALNDHFSLVGGDFINSFKRNTAFAGVSWEPVSFKFSGAKIAFGGMLGFDLNGGYRGFNAVDPLLGALNIRLSAADYRENKGFFHNFGLLATIIPPNPKAGSTAINLALTYHLP